MPHFLGVRDEAHCHREREEGDHGRGGRRKGAHQVQDQNRAHVRGRARLMVGDGRRHEHKHEDGGHGLQGRHEQAAQQAHRLCGARCDQSKDDAQNECDDDLLDETTPEDKGHGSVHQASRFLRHKKLPVEKSMFSHCDGIPSKRL
jgi:hypothetical protein